MSHEPLFGTPEQWRNWRQWIGPFLIMLAEAVLIVAAVVLFA